MPPLDLFAELSIALADADLSTKPSVRRTGIESWFPYYAGYSARFVEEIIRCLDLPARSRILDPWNGSGTTTAVADRMGYDAIGFDINPVAVTVGSARLVRPQDALHSEGLVQEILSIANRFVDMPSSDPLAPWLSRRLRNRYRSIEFAILNLLGSIKGKRIDPTKDAVPPLASFLLLCLVRAAKTFTKFSDRSNPTWSLPERPGDAHPSKLDAAFAIAVRTSASDTEKEILQSSTRMTASYSRLADSKFLPLETGSIHSVITSPPYCTRLDYVKATEFELAALGIGSDSDFYRMLRESAMGTNLIRRRDDIVETNRLPKSVVTLLKNIHDHPSKATTSYYLKHFTQYFEDAQRSVSELARVLEQHGAAILVVQSSYYKELPIPLGELYVSMARHAGLKAEIVHRIPVKKVMSSLNTKSTKYLQKREYSEDVVAAIKVK